MRKAFEKTVIAMLSQRIVYALNRHSSKLLLAALLAGVSSASAQETFPVNGLADPRESCFAFTHATLIKDAQTTLSDATLVIRDGKITEAGPSAVIPKDAVVIDCKGKYIYPSFVDIFSNYGLAEPKKGGSVWNAPPQFLSNTKGAYGWNQAIRSEINAVDLFSVSDEKASPLREAGFGTVLTQQQDGIARGTAALVSLATARENKVIIREKAAAAYSFDKGSSTQNYPNSLMGCIALLRQTYLDAQWYKTPAAGKEGVNLSLQSWNANQQLPQLFEAGDKWDVLRANKIGNEFGVRYIIKGSGNEYQRIKEVAATKAAFILPLNFPAAPDVEDPNDARFVSLADMKHWEMAPGEPAAFEKAGITFCLTAADLKEVKQFMANLRKAISYGLSEEKALDALTRTPATLIKAYDKVGSLEAGKLANFLITNGPLFNEKTQILQNWVQGNRYEIKAGSWNDIRGIYTLSLTPGGNMTIEIKGAPAAPSLAVLQKDTLQGRIETNGKLLSLSLPQAKNVRNNIRLSGIADGNSWAGTGIDTSGNTVKWTAVFVKPVPEKTDTPKRAEIVVGPLYYPFNGYGWEKIPQQEDLLIKNATVWTSEKEGNLENTDVLIRNGKIAQIGRNLAAGNARVIDGTGKHLSAGIIDEHSHIAISKGVNESSQSVTAEVRIADVLNPDDVNIYRQLSGGVTASHLLHGSANAIGGQSQLIKLRWGQDAEGLKVANCDPFIKFALGENVKQSNWGERNTTRFPQTRMGVEQIYTDAFTRARDYEKQGPGKRRDLELDALVEILHQKRFITCHSYVQSEINMLMHVADSFHFHVNTFTHILEGYKMADKMKAHGAGAGTFADWWAYKMEVQDAIPYNATIMQRVGVVTAINSDDAEMARRLNQEAAKSIRYGGMEEQDALKMVTINPAKLLHVDSHMGSIKVGKDADVVLWSNHPLSVYAKADITIVDGIVEFDRNNDLKLRERIAAERNRLARLLLSEKKKGTPTQKATFTPDEMYHCEDLQGGHETAIGY
jgi:imidazolonepropionase-like amidohydrolase